MKLAAYSFEYDSRRACFEFVSEGPKGQIVKLVELMPTGSFVGNQEIYNLALGDRDPTGQLDDQPISANGDAQRVLLTVAAIVDTFTTHRPGALVYAEGGTPSRTRLYQMGIANNLSLILPDFDVFGLLSDNWQVFQRGVSYEAFLVRRKDNVMR